MVFTEIDNYKDVIHACFKTDEELYNKYHIVSGTGLQNCVDRTYADLQSAETLMFYIITLDDELVGFFGKELHGDREFLTSIFIKPQYRSKDFMQSFWLELKEFFNNSFITGLYKKNTRAVDYFIKNGGRIIRDFEYQSNPAVLIEVG